jgi:hypothetical protein
MPARRVSGIKPFTVLPQQTDYVALWKTGQGPAASSDGGLRNRLPAWLKRWLKRLCNYDGLHPRFFTRMERKP